MKKFFKKVKFGRLKTKEDFIAHALIALVAWKFLIGPAIQKFKAKKQAKGSGPIATDQASYTSGERTFARASNVARYLPGYQLSGAIR
jgi:hypothetical protein